MDMHANFYSLENLFQKLPLIYKQEPRQSKGILAHDKGDYQLLWTLLELLWMMHQVCKS